MTETTQNKARIVNFDYLVKEFELSGDNTIETDSNLLNFCLLNDLVISGPPAKSIGTTISGEEILTDKSKRLEYIHIKDVVKNTLASLGAIHINHVEDLVYPEYGLYFNAIASPTLPKLHHKDMCVWNYLEEFWCLKDDADWSWCDNPYPSGYLNDANKNKGRYKYVHYGEAEGRWVKVDEVRYCSDIEDFCLKDEAYFNERDEDWVFDEENARSEYGPGVECIQEYHCGDNSENLTNGSNIAIGFEVEKIKLKGYDEVGDHIGCYDLFARYETDSSCGTEAITHVLPLSGVRSTSRKKVFEMIDEASEIIDGDCNKYCGGHITISAGKGSDSAFSNPMKSIDLLERIKGNLSIVYALYRYRLNNSYCSGNKDLKPNIDGGYHVVKLKNRINAVEIRLFNRVINTTQLKLRYDLMYLIVRRSLDNVNFDEILKEVKPILMKMYENNEHKVENILELSVYFRTYLIADIIHESINCFINDDDND